MTTPLTPGAERPAALPGPAAGPAPGAGDSPPAGLGGPAGGAQIPAGPATGQAGQTGTGSVRSGEGRTLPVPRTWTVELDPLPLLNANQRLHHMARAKATRLIREHAGWKTIAARIPRLQRAEIVVEVRFPDSRNRDVGNWYPSAKAAIDGAVSDAGLLPGDDDAHLAGPFLVPGPVERGWPRDISRRGLGRGRMLLHITELPEVPR